MTCDLSVLYLPCHWMGLAVVTVSIQLSREGCLLTLTSLIGNLRSYNGNCKENVTLKLNFAWSKVFGDYSMFITLYKIGEVYFRLLGTNGFLVKAKNKRFTAASSRCRRNLKYENFTWSFGRLRQNIAPKSMLHVQHDYFSSFNQSNHWLFSLTLPSSNLKLPIKEKIEGWKPHTLS